MAACMPKCKAAVAHSPLGLSWILDGVHLPMRRESMVWQSGDLVPADWPSLTVEADEAFNLTSFALSLLLVRSRTGRPPACGCRGTGREAARRARRHAARKGRAGSCVTWRSRCFQRGSDAPADVPPPVGPWATCLDGLLNRGMCCTRQPN